MISLVWGQPIMRQQYGDDTVPCAEEAEQCGGFGLYRC